MKTGSLQPPDEPSGDAQAPPLQATPAALAASSPAILALAEATPADDDFLQRARAFAQPFLLNERFDTGELAQSHADGVCAILQGIGAPRQLRGVAQLVYASQYLKDPHELVTRAFGPDAAALVTATARLVQVQRNARESLQAGASAAHGPLAAEQVERIRKMLLAFSRDLRVVLLRLASRLQTLRFYAAERLPCPPALARESLQVFAPLANRLGIWQIKWEVEDLSFRFLQPDTYRDIARQLDEKRLERERSVEAARQHVAASLQHAGLGPCEVQGRPKHLYSIWKKMQGKNLPLARVFDVQALRVIVPDVPACYAALGRIHELYTPLPEEFDDYIARPKPNGYQSLHTVVLDPQGRPIEVQIRTRAMHDQAESGVAAHWAYKEAGTRGYGGVTASGDFETRVAEARKTVLRQLLAWERDLAHAQAQAEPEAGQGESLPGRGLFDDRIYVFTPEGTIIDLPAGASPVDFAYTVHTTLGHRCRGAKVDGVMVPLNTPLHSGQTVEITAAKDGGPSLDWLNGELGYVRSPRARAKVRAWFNALAQQDTIARGREAVEKLLQRQGRTSSLKLDELATQLGFRSADALFEVVGKDEFSLRTIEAVLKPAEPAPDADQFLAQRLSKPETQHALPTEGKGVLVVGLDTLLSQLARCCKPAPGDAIGGFVTRGRGVSVHRSDCSNLRQMALRQPERMIAVTWGAQAGKGEKDQYAVDVLVEAHDRPGLLRDVCDAFAQGKTHVSAMRSQPQGDRTFITLTVNTADTSRLSPVIHKVAQVRGVVQARRK